MKKEKITVDPENRAVFNNRVDYCVGTGRLGLALTEEYLKELAYVQEMIGFSLYPFIMNMKKTAKPKSNTIIPTSTVYLMPI